MKPNDVPSHVLKTSPPNARRCPGGVQGWGRALALALALAVPLGARADERLFTYVSEADVVPKGEWEFEQWLTHRNDRGSGVFSAWDIREEIEYGLLDNLSTALYLNFRQQSSDGVDGLPDRSEFKFRGVSTELKWRLLNPNIQPIGLTLYLEPRYSGDEFELEEKIILQKNFGEKWTTAFNVVFEQEWEFESGGTERELTLELAAGVSYRLSPHWAVGVEGRNHREFEDMDFGKRSHSAWFVGPNLHYGSAGWWATLTVLPQVAGDPATRDGLHLRSHERVEVRLIFGLDL